MNSNSREAIFLDRDGTLIEEKDFLTKEEDIEIFEHSAEAVRLLKELGYFIVVVSNQSGVARGYLTEKRVVEINDEIFRRLDKLGARPDLFFYCPHHPDAEVEKYRVDCNCRKPAAGMVRMAQQSVDIDIGNSISVGDKLSDVQLCQRLGGKGILVLTGYGMSEKHNISASGIQPDFVADTLLDAARWIEKIAPKNNFC